MTSAGFLRPCVSKESSLLAYAPTNSLIVTDAVGNINRLLKIITALDVESPSTIFKVVTLKFAQAEQIANALRSAVEGLGAGLVQMRIRTPGHRRVPKRLRPPCAADSPGAQTCASLCRPADPTRATRRSRRAYEQSGTHCDTGRYRALSKTWWQAN